MLTDHPQSNMVRKRDGYGPQSIISVSLTDNRPDVENRFTVTRQVHTTLLKYTYDLDLDRLDLHSIVQQVDRGKTDDITTVEIQDLTALCTADFTNRHPDYALLAGRLAVASLQRRTPKSFSRFVLDTFEDYPHLFHADFVRTVQSNADAIDAVIRHSRDFEMTYFMFKTLERSYLLKHKGEVIERPQFLWMRTALQLHGADFPAASETYDLLSRGFYVHATPTLKNSGTPFPQLASCFMQALDTESVSTMFGGLQQTAKIFMHDGGVGVDLNNVPATRTDRVPHQPGLLPLMRLFDATTMYTTQSRPGRASASAVFVAPWHADILEFLDARANNGIEQKRTRHIFTGLTVPDLFMKHVRDNERWSLFDPVDVPQLLTCYGSNFDTAYCRYERQGLARLVLPAREIWYRTIQQQIETGTPFIIYRDAVNSKSNQRNIGIINSSNLCTEIMQHISPTETAVCTLASLVLPTFVTPTNDFDFATLHRVTKAVVRNTDRIIDLNYYLTEEAKRSAERTRPIGVGVQGLADLFQICRLPFDSVDARRLSTAISETVYHAAVEASCDLAQSFGSYPAWEGSPASSLQLQFDLWAKRPSGRYDWAALKTRIGQHGLRNSLLTAQMPTSSTSQITGVNDGVDPYISNVYMRRGIGIECQIINKWLIRDLIQCDLWNDDMRRHLVQSHGSIQNIPDIPTELKDLYKTAWEMSQKSILDLAASRGPFICQSQSMSIYMADPTYKKLTSMHFYGWGAGLKTGMYYLRTKPAVYPIQFGLEPQAPPPTPNDEHPDGSDDTPPLTAHRSDGDESISERPLSALDVYPPHTLDDDNTCACSSAQLVVSPMSSYTSATACSVCAC